MIGPSPSVTALGTPNHAKQCHSSDFPSSFRLQSFIILLHQRRIEQPLVATINGARLLACLIGDEPDDVIFLRYNELRVLMADPAAGDVRAAVAERRAERERSEILHPPAWIGTATESQLAFPYLVNWGFPEKFHRGQGTSAGEITGVAGSPGTVEGVARVVLSEAEFDGVQPGDVLVCEMTNPAWQVLFPKISGLVTNAGGFAAHPAVLAREYEIPAVVGTSVATDRIRTGDRIRITQRKVTGEDGKVQINDIPAGATFWDPATTHSAENIGGSGSKMVLIEIKDKDWKPATG